jgi:hypothetical protein
MRHVQSGGDFAVMKQLDFRWHAGLIEPATATVMPEQSRHQLVISEFDNPIFSGIVSFQTHLPLPDLAPARVPWHSPANRLIRDCQCTM